MSRAPSPPPSLSPTLTPAVPMMHTSSVSTDALASFRPPVLPTQQPMEVADASTATPAQPPQPPAKPQIAITLLLVSGRRRTLNFDIETSIGTLKDVIWNSWPSEWADEQPPSASFLRILYLGKILTDETLLSSFNLPQFTPPSPTSSQTGEQQTAHPLTEEPIPTVFHVSVRSFAPAGSEDDMNKSKKRRRRMMGGSSGQGAGTGDATSGGSSPGGERDEAGNGGCCGCVIC